MCQNLYQTNFKDQLQFISYRGLNYIIQTHNIHFKPEAIDLSANMIRLFYIGSTSTFLLLHLYFFINIFS